MLERMPKSGLVQLLWCVLFVGVVRTFPLFPFHHDIVEVNYATEKSISLPEVLLVRTHWNLSTNSIVPEVGQQRTPEVAPLNRHSWSVVDDLSADGNETAVMIPSKNFGYIVHRPEYKKFRYEEKTEDGYINGQFGIHENNGAVRGVQYTADIGVNPKFLYLALLKFMAM